MPVRIRILITGIVALLQFFSSTLCSAAASPDTCGNPIVISSIIISNSACGLSSGVIIISLQDGFDGYNFQWEPNVSDSQVSAGLQAGTYTIHIERVGNPDCFVDTTVIVNNSNGPDVDVAEVLPANCQSPNGAITLAPADFNYIWSNGDTGVTIDGLAEGCYYVTATDPGTGCNTVLKVCVPNKNPLQSEFQVVEPAKCGLPTGSGQVSVTGGSGQYSFSFGSTSLVTNTAPGVYTYFVIDDVTGCRDTVTAVMTDTVLLGEVMITPYNIKCVGTGNGNVEFAVVPGSNFKSPYTFTLTDMSGAPQSPGDLPGGSYILQITDADGCRLPADTFDILQPPAFTATATVTPESCSAGGQIQLTLSGGNGRYIVDWSDLPGYDNPRNRLNLEAGFYRAIVYDSLFCAYPTDTILVPAYCKVADTLTLIVAANDTGYICLPLPVGVDSSALTFAVVSQSAVFGNWALDPEGCLSYRAGPVAKFGVDPICVAVQSPTPGLSDTVCVIVNITTLPPDKDSIYFAVQVSGSITTCGYVPPNYNNRVVSLLAGQGLSGTSDAFGAYLIDKHSACITFSAYDQPGYNVDEIGVAICDTVLRQCHVICYIPSVLSPYDCLDGIDLPDSLALVTDDCDAGATACLPIPFAQFFDFSILDNGVPYTGTVTGCTQKTEVAYPVRLNNGPYQLAEWKVDNQVFSGFFTDAYQLLGLLNQFDPVPGWTLQNDSVFIGGDLTHLYGPLRIISAQDQSIEVTPNPYTFFAGTEMPFAAGQHTLIFRRVQTGCLDTSIVRVICTDCPPIHKYTPNGQDEIDLTIVNCAGDTNFCTNILLPNLAEYTITDNGQVFSSFSFCGNNVALRLDTGFHLLHILNNISFCNYTVKARLGCSGQPGDTTLLAVPDEATTLKSTLVEISLLANDIIRGIAGNVDGLDKLELLSTPPNGTVFYDDFLGIVTYTPNDGYCGTDTFSYRITDTTGRSSFTQVRITVVCDKVLVYTGISPNNDGKNDFWHIVGIDQFPDNEVRIFNRWGNLVFEKKGYSNQDAWGGTWNGKDLPDGAYFYLLDLGDGSAILSGYLQLMR